MVTPRSRSIAGGLALALLAGLAPGCHLAGAKAWNLEQVHEPDGRPKRRGHVQSDTAFLLDKLFTSSNFGGEGYREEQQQRSEERIDDPLGTCLENVVELAKCRQDEGVVGMQAATYSWLAVDCTYVLSRERCVLELGELGRMLEVADAPPPVEPETPLTPEQIKAIIEPLVKVVREVIAVPDLAGSSLKDACAEIDATPLDREAAVRVLRTVNVLLEQRSKGAALAPLRELRLALARRCVQLALVAARSDSQGRVRAAALRSGVRAFPAQRAELLRWAVVEPMEGVEERDEVTFCALALLARYGLPPTPEGVTEEAFRDLWLDLLVQVLRSELGGRSSTAACQAFAKITGEPVNLRPEHWILRWLELHPPAVEPKPAARPADAPPIDDGQAGDGGQAGEGQQGGQTDGERAGE